MTDNKLQKKPKSELSKDFRTAVISLENNLNQLWTTVHTTSQFQSRTYTGSSNSDQHHFVSSNGDLA